jgi:aldose 1-epimerase
MVIDLQAGEARATVIPALGAGIGRLDWRGMPVLRPWGGSAEDGPFALGMNLLVPFSNRIAGGFVWDGAWHEVAPNLPGEDFAIHGDGFQREWAVESAGVAEAVLTLRGGIGPWAHDTRVVYALEAGGLECRLEMVNRGEGDLPFGGGFHPWFPRDAQTRVQFCCDGYWPEDRWHLPATTAPVTLPEGWGWETPAPLPGDWINAGFAGWDGGATIWQGDLRVGIVATGCETTVVYSPGADSGFFCFEPVSHPVDAVNLPDTPGLVRLAPGGKLTLTMSLSWDAT